MMYKLTYSIIVEADDQDEAVVIAGGFETTDLDLESIEECD